MKPSLNLSYPWLPQQDTKPIVCCMCDGRGNSEEVFHFVLNGAPFSIIRCIRDDLMYVFPQPGTLYTHVLYNHPSYFGGQEDMYGHGVTEAKGKETGEVRMNELQLRGGLPKNMLEIGCGLGYTLEIARAHGIEAYGIEFSEVSVAACLARGLKVFLGTVDSPMASALTTYGPFETIALYSVLEHMPNPKAFLKALRPMLMARGRVVIRVPRMSEQGPWLSLLDHFWHFTPTSLRSLLEELGYSITDIFPSGSFVSSTGEKLQNMTAIANII